MTMFSTTKRNICNGALVVVLVILLVIVMKDRNQFLELEPLLKVIKQQSYKTPEPMQPLKNHSVMVGYTNPALEQLRRNGRVILPGKEEMNSMSQEALFQTYHSYLDNNDILCNRKLRLGKMGDGGWEVCDDKLYRPSAECVVYSFGINNDFSFDDEISRVYNCSVLAFDPSMKQESYQRSPRVYFLQMGIADRNYTNSKKWELRTYGFFLNKFNHMNRYIDVLKMDVENSEWPSLPEMVKSGHLRKVKQLLLEFHGRSKNKSKMISDLSILKDIHDLGFRKFYVHKNFHCTFKTNDFLVARTSCYEVHYLNVNLVAGYGR